MRLHSHPGPDPIAAAAEGPPTGSRYFRFHAPTRAPRIVTPALACDSQIHVFGSAARYPVRPDAVYAAPEANFAEARAMHLALGIRRAVLVQPTTYGTDHAALLDALRDGGEAVRGCAVIDDSVSDVLLGQLHAAGVRGARFNFFPALRSVPDPAGFRRTLARIGELGWYAKLNLDPEGSLDLAGLLRPLRLPVVIDHFGRPDFGAGPDGPSAWRMREALGRGNVWVMLSNGHKLSRAGPPWDDAIPMARAYLDAAPDRIIWGSDWPHPLSTEPVPDDADLLELLWRMVPDEAERRRILVDNPAALFGFPAQ